MSDHDEFVTWFGTVLREAEIALHNGDPGPRRAVWSEREPVTLLGAWYTTSGSAPVRAVFDRLAAQFSGCTSYQTELIAAVVEGDTAYSVAVERASLSVNGEPTSFVIRVTQVYRREDGGWRVAHRHGDLQPLDDHGPDSPPGSGSPAR